MEFGKPPEFYEALVEHPFRRDLTVLETLWGNLDIGEIARYICITFAHRQAFEFRITNFADDDTFMGVPLPMSAKTFQSMLKERGIPTKKEGAIISVPGHDVKFHLDKSEIVSIFWQTKKPAAVTDSADTEKAER